MKNNRYGAILDEVEDYIFEFQVEDMNPRRSRTIMKVVEENYPELSYRHKAIC